MTDTKDDGDGEATRSGPPSPGAKAPGKTAHEETRVGGRVPVLPEAKPPPAPAPPRAEDADNAKTVIDEDLEETVFETHAPCSLMRVKPAGHGVPITLSESSYEIGRSRSCGIQLFSPSSHRRHAKLLARGGGWVLEPIDNSIVIANGDLVRGEVQVVHKMRLQLGEDELVFFDERKAAMQPRADTPTPMLGRRSLSTAQLAAIAVVVVVAAGVLLWWWVM